MLMPLHRFLVVLALFAALTSAVSAQLPLIGRSGEPEEGAAAVLSQEQLRAEVIRFGDEFVVKFNQTLVDSLG